MSNKEGKIFDLCDLVDLQSPEVPAIFGVVDFEGGGPGDVRVRSVNLLNEDRHARGDVFQKGEPGRDDS